MVGVGGVIGFRFHRGTLEALAAIGTAIMAGSAFAWLGSLLAVAFRTPEAVQGIGFAAIFPLVFASSTFVPVTTMPWSLQIVAKNTPITAAADAVRALSLGLPLHELPLVAVMWLAGTMLVAAAAARVIYNRMSG